MSAAVSLADLARRSGFRVVECANCGATTVEPVEELTEALGQPVEVDCAERTEAVLGAATGAVVGPWWVAPRFIASLRAAGWVIVRGGS